MRNQKWNQFNHSDDEIPETWYEACVFLDHAIAHLRNRDGGPLGENFDILNGAHNAVRDERKVAA